MKEGLTQLLLLSIVHMFYATVYRRGGVRLSFTPGRGSMPTFSRTARLGLAVGFSLVLVGVVSSTAPCQETTGAIFGTVRDNSGAALAGTTVSLTGPTIAGARAVTADLRGQYRFPALSPGLYDLELRLDRFTTVKRTGVRVRVGETSEVNVTLGLAPVSETITVEAANETVDTQSAKLGSHFDKEWIDNAPIARTPDGFFDILKSAPGVDPASAANSNQNAGGQPISFGSMLDQNQYQFDGIDLTDSFNGNPSTLVRPSIDIIQDVEVLSLGAPAEYGNVQGAVYNIVTRQGTNAVHGSAAYYYQGDGLTGRNTTDAQDGGLPFKRITYGDVSAQLGGPIIKDKLWFYAAYEHVKDSSAAGVKAQFAQAVTLDHAFAKLNYQISPQHSIVAGINYDQTDTQFPIHPNQAPSTQFSTHRTIPAPTVSYTGILSSNTTIEARYAGFYADHKNGKAPSSGPDFGTYFYNLDTSATSGHVSSWYEYHVSRTTANVKLTHSATNFLKAVHDFKFGVQYNAAPAQGLYAINDRVYVSSDPTQNGYGLAYTPYEYGGTAVNVGAFADDTVRVGSRLTLSVGLRYDYTHTRASSEPQLDVQGRPTGTVFPGVDYYTWNTFSPRFGFNLKLQSEGKTVLKGHYGRYYRGGTTGEFATSVPSVSPELRGKYDPATNSFTNLVLVADNTNLSIDKNMKAPNTDQFVLAIEQEIFKSAALSVGYVGKRSRDFTNWIDVGGIYSPITYVDNVGTDATGRSLTVFQLQNQLSDRRFVLTTPPGSTSQADYLTLAATKRMSHRWQLTTSLTWGKASGDRVRGISATQNFRSFGRNPNDYVNRDGLLPADRRYVFKTQFLYEGLPLGITLGLDYFYANGYPKSRENRIPATNLFDLALMQPLSNDLRFPNLNELDLRLQKNIKLAKAATLRVFANVFNVFNDNAYQGYLSDVGTSSNYGVINLNKTLPPRRAMLGAKVDF
jgi:outer membrane receptor protein involved in Fe transport